MLVQDISVVLIVIGCAFYAAWTLMPAAARRRIALALLAYPLPGSMDAAMRRHATAASGCGCDGCDKSPVKPALAAAQPIRFHPRPPR